MINVLSTHLERRSVSTQTVTMESAITTLTDILSVLAKMAGKDLTATQLFHACATARSENALMGRTLSTAQTALKTSLAENVNT